MSVGLAALTLVQPETVADAIAAYRAHPESLYVAGGTDLIVNMRRGIARADRLIDLSGVEALTGVAFDGRGLSIGAGARIASIAADPEIAKRYPAVAQAAAAIAAPGHRNVATLGGNLCLDTRCIYYNQSEWWRKANSYCLKNRGDTCHVAPQGERCHAAFSGDLAPAFLVLGAEIEIAGVEGGRRIPLADLYVEDGRAHLALAPGEILTRVHVPADVPASTYEKVRVRGAIDYPLAGVAVALSTHDAKIAALRIALTGTNSRPFLLEGIDGFAGRAVDEALLKEIDRLVQRQVQPMRTTLAAAHYRRLAAAAIAKRAVTRLAAL